MKAVDVAVALGLGVLTWAVAAFFAPRGFNSGFVDLAHDGYQLREVTDLFKGGMVFRDTFDQYGAFDGYLNLIGFVLLGKNLLAMKYFVAAWYFGSAVLLYAVARQLLSVPLSIFAGVLWLALAPFYQHGIMLSPHAYLLAFQAAAILLMFRYVETPSAAWLAPVGLLSAICWGLKQPIGFEFLAAIALVVVLNLRLKRRPLARAGVHLAALGASFAAVVGATLWWLHARGALDDWYRQTIQFPRVFYFETLPDAAKHARINSMLSLAASFLPLQLEAELHWLVFRVAILAAGVVAWIRKSEDAGRLTLMAALTAGLWLGAFPSGNFMHQWWTITPTLAAAVYVIHQLAMAAGRRWFPGGGSRLAGWAAVAVIAAIAGSGVGTRAAATRERLEKLTSTIDEPYSIRGIRTGPVAKESLDRLYVVMNNFRSNHPGTRVVSIDSSDGDKQGIAESLPLLTFFDDNAHEWPVYWSLPALSTTVYPSYRRDLAALIDTARPLVVDYRLGLRPAVKVPDYYILAIAPSNEGRWIIYAPRHADALVHGERPQTDELTEALPDGTVTPRLKNQDSVTVEIDGHPQPAILYVWPGDSAFALAEAGRWQPTDLGDATYIAKELMREGGRLIVSGQVPASYSYLLKLAERRMDDGDYFFAQGMVTGGGVTIGLQASDRWAGYVNVDRPGAFVVVLAPPITGIYSVTLANFVPAAALADRVGREGMRAGMMGWLQHALTSHVRIDAAGFVPHGAVVRRR